MVICIVDKYSDFMSAVGLGNTLLWRFSFIGAVDTFDGIRGVNLPDIHGELENWANGIPVVVPAVH